MNEKYAVITMDLEDWYHTGYLADQECPRDFSILDVTDQFLMELEKAGARATLFVLGELVRPLENNLNAWAKRGHEIASHGWSHTPPLKLEMEDFKEEIRNCLAVHRKYLNRPLVGYRAPLFSLDQERLDFIVASGFLYDSSGTARGRRTTQFALPGFQCLREQIYQRDGFFEFQVGAPGWVSYFINGGGGTRILPWSLSKPLLRSFIAQRDFYNFYTHPLDFSIAELPLPSTLPWLKKKRMLYGRIRMLKRFAEILTELKRAEYQFVTFRDLRKILLEVSPVELNHIKIQA